MTSTTSTRVLLADADKAVCDTLAGYFVRAGWEFDIVSSGKAGLAACRTRAYDVVLTDYDIPDLASLEFIRELRSLRPAQACILLAQAIPTEQVIACLREGVSDLIHKPIDFDCLLHSVSRVAAGVKKDWHVNLAPKNLKKIVHSFEFDSRELGCAGFSLEILEKLQRVGILSENLKRKLDLAFAEALANAVEHGNLELESKWREEIDSDGLDRFSKIKAERIADDAYGLRKVRILAEYKNRLLRITIEDQGKGFNYEGKLKSSGHEREVLCYGRGVSLITSLMDEVEYSRGGSKLEMIKRLGTKERSD
ncbi:MAG: ATP-binding protein [Bdellovibrionales bacterium]|nr:ATP-binding protein [Bdellovibrionales bacterium]